MAMIKTMKLDYRAALHGPTGAERQLREPRIVNDRLVRQMGDPDWRDNYRSVEGNAYFGTNYTLNTKYVVDAEEHPEIGSIVTLPGGKTVHVDANVDFIHHRGNQR